LRSREQLLTRLKGTLKKCGFLNLGLASTMMSLENADAYSAPVLSLMRSPLLSATTTRHLNWLIRHYVRVTSSEQSCKHSFAFELGLIINCPQLPGSPRRLFCVVPCIEWTLRITLQLNNICMFVTAPASLIYLAFPLCLLCSPTVVYICYALYSTSVYCFKAGSPEINNTTHSARVLGTMKPDF
jgi:hypothetical protein